MAATLMHTARTIRPHYLLCRGSLNEYSLFVNFERRREGIVASHRKTQKFLCGYRNSQLFPRE